MKLSGAVWCVSSHSSSARHRHLFHRAGWRVAAYRHLVLYHSCRGVSQCVNALRSVCKARRRGGVTAASSQRKRSGAIETGGIAAAAAWPNRIAIVMIMKMSAAAPYGGGALRWQRAALRLSAKRHGAAMKTYHGHPAFQRAGHRRRSKA